MCGGSRGGGVGELQRRPGAQYGDAERRVGLEGAGSLTGEGSSAKRPFVCISTGGTGIAAAAGTSPRCSPGGSEEPWVGEVSWCGELPMDCASWCRLFPSELACASWDASGPGAGDSACDATAAGNCDSSCGEFGAVVFVGR